MNTDEYANDGVSLPAACGDWRRAVHRTASTTYRVIRVINLSTFSREPVAMVPWFLP